MDSRISDIVKYLTTQDVNRVESFINSLKENKDRKDENYRKFKISAMTDIRAALKSNYFLF